MKIRTKNEMTLTINCGNYEARLNYNDGLLSSIYWSPSVIRIESFQDFKDLVLAVEQEMKR